MRVIYEFFSSVENTFLRPNAAHWKYRPLFHFQRFFFGGGGGIYIDIVSSKFHMKSSPKKKVGTYVTQKIAPHVLTRKWTKLTGRPYKYCRKFDKINLCPIVFTLAQFSRFKLKTSRVPSTHHIKVWEEWVESNYSVE